MLRLPLLPLPTLNLLLPFLPSYLVCAALSRDMQYVSCFTHPLFAIFRCLFGWREHEESTAAKTVVVCLCYLRYFFCYFFALFPSLLQLCSRVCLEARYCSGSVVCFATVYFPLLDANIHAPSLPPSSCYSSSPLSFPALLLDLCRASWDMQNVSCFTHPFVCHLLLLVWLARTRRKHCGIDWCWLPLLPALLRSFVFLLYFLLYFNSVLGHVWEHAIFLGVWCIASGCFPSS